MGVFNLSCKFSPCFMKILSFANKGVDDYKIGILTKNGYNIKS